jgi:hypothetical protein
MNVTQNGDKLCFLVIQLGTDKINKVFGRIKGKAIPVTGRGGPQGCETSRLPRFLDNPLTNGSEVISLTCRPSLTPPEDS